MSPVYTYLADLRLIRASGAAVPETSYYPALANLLNAVGAALQPRVTCVFHPANAGAGIPDGGFFTRDQLQTGAAGLFRGVLPARGALEVKPPMDDVVETARSEQVRGYVQRYGQVLVTNYRDFLIVAQDSTGGLALGERYTLAESAGSFWAALAAPAALAEAHERRLLDYLQRVLLLAAPLTGAADVARVLASYAREARARVERVALPALDDLRAALEQALGIGFQGPQGDHFFRSTLVQTLFYGIFSAWVLWSKRQAADARAARFDWRLAQWELHIPMLRALFERVATPSRLGTLGLLDVLTWTGAALNRIDRGSFFARFEESHAVQYFYEPFLEAFDPELRKQLGVWYTPPEIVRYMVSRVDSVLREELDIPLGLADPRVYVLDPCCGTGAYLVEVLQRIAETLREEGGDALLGEDLKQAALTRVFGFEILPAPFVVSHLQLGLLLQSLGAPLSTDAERPAVYLTNALTGWQPPSGPRQRLPLPELEAERDAAEHVKRDRPILVVLGNPPYNGFAGVAVDEERDLVAAYRTTSRAPRPEGQGLNDLYVRFFRIAERRIVEHTGRGIVCFISNYSWLDGLSFTGMRERYLTVFDKVWIDNLHGDRKISEYAPDGRTSETVFAMQGTSPGIQIGTAVSLLVAGTETAAATTQVLYRDVDQARAEERRAVLLASAAERDLERHYVALEPSAELGFPLKPARVAPDYGSWPLLPDLLPASFPGVKTSRDDVVVDIDRDRLVERMLRYFDPNVSHGAMRAIAPGAMASTARFKAEAVRDHLRRRGFLADNVVPYCYRPFDTRWLYWEPEAGLLDRARPDYFPHVFDGNVWLEARQRQPMADYDRGYFVRALADNFGNGLSSFFPLYLAPDAGPPTLFSAETASDPRPNLSDAARAYLDRLGATERDLFYHLLAVLQAPAYRWENAGALRLDWPRLPLPASAELLCASANLGRQVAALLDEATPAPNVTAAPLRPALSTIGAVTRAGGGALHGEDLAITVGWGHAGKGGVTMPGVGRLVARPYTDHERAALASEAAALGVSEADVLACLGEETCDVYLNDVAYWRNVPSRVWEHTISGYQVIKKWLSYRECPECASSAGSRDATASRFGLGRPLTPAEAREVTGKARRIAALLLLHQRLNANYLCVKQDAAALGPHREAPTVKRA